MKSLWTPYVKDDTVLDLSTKVPDHHVSPALTSSLDAGLVSATCVPPHTTHVQPSLSPERSIYSEGSCSSPLLSPGWSTGSRSPIEPALRPFKVVTSSTAVSAIKNDDPAFVSFREDMLQLLKMRNGGSLAVTNPRMRRAVKRSQDTQDAAYVERRQKNNAAAKRSRDIRKLREDELAIRAAFLEQENKKLLLQLQAVREELADLRGRSFRPY